MRSILIALATGAALSLGALSAEAMPAATMSGSDAAPALILVSGGCGPGAHPGRFGGCRPNGFYRPAYGYGCFVRPTPFGPRRICR